MKKAPRPLLDSTESANYLGLTNHKTLNEWRRRGEGPSYVKIGRLVRYKLDDLMAFIEARKFVPSAGVK